MILAITGCASIDPSKFPDKSVSHHVDYQHGSILDNFLEQPDTYPDDYSGFYPLEKGHDALLTRLALIESAQTTLDVQYYIYRNDETSQLISWRLYEAAERGVRVRLLLDDMQKRSDKGMAYINAHPNIEVRLFNPHQYRTMRGLAFLSDFDRLNRRMHNKSLTADNVATIVGGRNIGNEYFSFESSVEFGDFDVLLHGNTVTQVSEQFDKYWNSDYSVPMEWIIPDSEAVSSQDVEQWLEESQIEAKFSQGQYNFKTLPLYTQLQESDLHLFWGPAVLYYDRPEKIAGKGSQLIDDLSELLEQTQHSLVLISPYFVPTESGTQVLVEAAKSGKDVTIITNSLASNDVFAVHGWYAKYRQDLVEGGVDLWEVKATADVDNKWSMTGSSRSSLHAKAMMLDERKLFVGSMNLDPRSADLNTEMAVVIDQPEYVKRSLEQLPKQLKLKAYQVKVEDNDIVWVDHKTGETLTSEPDASIWRRMGAWFSGILPIEDQL
ncbi:phospholipase D family protein [Vibrio paucivorans]